MASADDASQDGLLAQLPAVPFAELLLLGSGVFRLPVEPAALAWQLGAVPWLPRNPEPEPMPEVAWPDGSGAGSELLVALGLMFPVDGEDGFRRWQVDAGTAHRLAGFRPPEELAEAHRRAALYWRWKVEKAPQSRQQDIFDLIEARHHHHHAGELDEAIKVTHWVCTQLDLWGDLDREEELLHEALGWVHESSAAAAALLGQLGHVANSRGDAAQAFERYQQSLAISEALGDSAGIAGSCHQLGIVAQDAGDPAQAEHWYRQSLALQEQLGNKAGIARSWHQLAMLAHDRGELDTAFDLYLRSLAIEQDLDNRAAMATSYHQLGLLAQQQGDVAKALYYYRQSFILLEERDDRAAMALSLSQQSILHTERGVPAVAVAPMLRSLALRLELGIPEDNNMYWLARQRELLGEDLFRELLDQRLDEESRDSLLERL